MTRKHLRNNFSLVPLVAEAEPDNLLDFMLYGREIARNQNNHCAKHLVRNPSGNSSTPQRTNACVVLVGTARALLATTHPTNTIAALLPSRLFISASSDVTRRDYHPLHHGCSDKVHRVTIHPVECSGRGKRRLYPLTEPAALPAAAHQRKRLWSVAFVGYCFGLIYGERSNGHTMLDKQRLRE